MKRVKKQKVMLSVLEGNSPVPDGMYLALVDKVTIEKGSMQVIVRLMDKIVPKKEGGQNDSDPS
jgi:hypothetical protein